MRPVHVSAAHEPQLLDFSAIITELNNAVDQFTCRCSGYMMTRVTKLTVVMVPFHPLSGSSYIPTPHWIANKHAVVNVKNLHDDMCFKLAVLSALFPVKKIPIAFRNTFRTKMASIAALFNFPSIRNSFQSSSAITLTLRFTVWQSTRRTSVSGYYTFRHTCICVRKESVYSC